MNWPADVSLIQAGLLAGAVGDFSLQLANQTPLGNLGLKSYFQNQSSLVAAGRASLLTGFWSGIFQQLSASQDLPSFLIYAAGLDIFYRYFHASLGFSDLANYYKQNTPVASVFWNICAGVVVWEIAKVF